MRKRKFFRAVVSGVAGYSLGAGVTSAWLGNYPMVLWHLCWLVMTSFTLATDLATDNE